MVSSAQPSSNGSFDPPYFGVLCSFVLDSTCDVYEDQVVDGVGVEKPAYTVIFYEYAWEYEPKVAVKDDLLLSTPHPIIYLDIFCSSSIFYSSCENISPDVSTSDHSQNEWDVSVSSNYEEEKYFFLGLLNLSSLFSRILEGEIF